MEGRLVIADDYCNEWIYESINKINKRPSFKLGLGISSVGPKILFWWMSIINWNYSYILFWKNYR